MLSRGASLLVLALAVPAHADTAAMDHAHHGHHDHGAANAEAPAVLGHDHDHDGIAVTLGALAATYEARLYQGNYEGLSTSVRWSRGGLGLGASVPLYRIDKNGRALTGIGDVMAHAHGMLHRGAWSMMGMLMVSAPTGDDRGGLGMGHVMLMPELQGRWSSDRMMVAITGGYCRGLAGANAHAEHGMTTWPLVAPMNIAEVTYGAETLVALAPTLAIGARVFGAVPTGEGVTRVITAGKVLWAHGRTQTGFELQHGTVGDPFELRGSIETTIRFE